MDRKIAILIVAILIVIAGSYYFMGNKYGSQNPLMNNSLQTSKQSAGQNQQPTNSPASTAQRKIDVMVKNNPTLGNIFTDGNGMTLYTYANDTKDASTCYGTCALNWPALLVSQSPKIASDLIASKFSVVIRTDGSKQAAFEGMPLYYFARDVKPGDTNGQGIGGVWSVYKVASDDLSSTPAPAPVPNTQQYP